MKEKKVPVKLLVTIAAIGTCTYIIGLCAINIWIWSVKDDKKRQAKEDAFKQAAHEYVQEKYGIEAEEYDYITKSNEGDGTIAYLVLKDDDGILFVVSSSISAVEYTFWDTYVRAFTAKEIEKKIGINVSNGKSKIYVGLNEEDINNIDINPENVYHLRFVAVIEGQPDEKTLDELYEIYTSIERMGYQKITFLVEYVDDTSLFDKTVENYSYFDDIIDHNMDKINAELLVTETNLSFEEFKECLELK